MQKILILLGCLLTTVVLQADPLSTGCCGKRKPGCGTSFIQEGFFDGCGCGGGGAGGSNEIPPDSR